MKRKLPLAAAAVACTIGVFAAPLSASAFVQPAPQSVGTTVDLWDNYDQGAYWGGAYMNVSNSNEYGLDGNWWNDRISSLWVWNPVNTITLYEWLGYRGANQAFVYGTDDLRWYNFDNITSSYYLSY